MSRTEKLIALAEAATPDGFTYWRSVVEGSDYQLKSQEWADLLEELDVYYKTAAVPPETIKQLVELCRLQHEALKEFVEPIEKRPYLCVIEDGRTAIAAFNKFEGGE